jgi:hypothetical protein
MKGAYTMPRIIKSNATHQTPKQEEIPVVKPVTETTFIPEKKASSDIALEESSNVDESNIVPDHYNEETSLACIDAMNITFGHNWTMHFCAITAYKYIWRYKNKNGIEDIRKANWYLNWYFSNTRESYETEVSSVVELRNELIKIAKANNVELVWDDAKKSVDTDTIKATCRLASADTYNLNCRAMPNDVLNNILNKL